MHFLIIAVKVDFDFQTITLNLFTHQFHFHQNLMKINYFIIFLFGTLEALFEENAIIIF